MPAVSTPGSDLLLPFQIEAGAVRGRLVRLSSALDTIVSAHGLPRLAGERLAETVLLSAALAGGLKYDGIFTLQVQAEGAISLVVADTTSDGALRAYARCAPERLDATAGTAPVPRCFGKGYLAFTVDQGPDTERYQGIVELAGATLAHCAQAYLDQSEQIPSAVITALSPAGDPWKGAALILQRMPLTERSPILTAEQAEEDWRRARILGESVEEAELLDGTLAPERLLHRLFHAEGLIVHAPRPLRAQCRCSRSRVETTLKSFGRAELADMQDETGAVTVTCEFCKTHYAFSPAQLDALFG